MVLDIDHGRQLHFLLTATLTVKAGEYINHFHVLLQETENL